MNEIRKISTWTFLIHSNCLLQVLIFPLTLTILNIKMRKKKCPSMKKPSQNWSFEKVQVEVEWNVSKAQHLQDNYYTSASRVEPQLSKDLRPYFRTNLRQKRSNAVLPWTVWLQVSRNTGFDKELLNKKIHERELFVV